MDKIYLFFICLTSLSISCDKERSPTYNECTTTINIKNNQIIEFETVFKFNKPIKNTLYFVVDKKMSDLKINGKSDFQYMVDSATKEKKIKLESSKYNHKKLNLHIKSHLISLNIRLHQGYY